MSFSSLTSKNAADGYLVYYTGLSSIEGIDFVQWNEGSTRLDFSGGARLTFPLGGSAASPQIAFGDLDTGFYQSNDDQLGVSASGSALFTFRSVGMLAASGNGVQIKNGGATSTNPVLIPRRTDGTTGIGSGGIGEFSLILSGIEHTKVHSSGTYLIDNPIFFRSPGDTNHGIQTTVFGDGTSSVEFWGGLPNNDGIVIHSFGQSVLGTYDGTTQRFSLIWDGGGPNQEGRVGVGTGTLNGTLTVGGDIIMQELSSPTDGSDNDGYGKLWINSANSDLTFRDDSGADFALLGLDLNSQVMLPQLDAVATPALAFGDGDTGLYERTDDVITFSLNGLRQFEMNGTEFGGGTSTSGGLKNVSGGATTPSLIPARNDDNTGIAHVAFPVEDQMTFVAGGVEAMRVTEDAGIAKLDAYGNFQVHNSNRIILPQVNNDSAPTISFGDGDTGFYEESDDVLSVTVFGAERFQFISGRFESATSAGPAMLNEAASATNPTFSPRQDDTDTGIGWNGIDQLSLVAGGVEALRLTNFSSTITLSSDGYINPKTDDVYNLGTESLRWKALNVGTDSLHVIASAGELTSKSTGRNWAIGINTASGDTEGHLRIQQGNDNVYHFGENGIKTTQVNGGFPGSDSRAFGAPSFYPRDDYRAARGTPSSPQNLLANYTLMEINAHGHDGTTFEGPPVASIRVRASGSFSGTSRPTYMDFATTDFSSINQVARMRISQSGLVGIGELSPNERLTVGVAGGVTSAAISVEEGTAPSGTSGFGKLYVNSTDAELHFVDESGNDAQLTNNGELASDTLAATLTPSGTTETVNFDNGNSHIIDFGSATGDVTLTLSNPVAGKTYLIKFIQGATARNAIWPAAVLWPSGGIAPIISTGNDEEDIITLWYDGTNYYGTFNKDFA